MIGNLKSLHSIWVHLASTEQFRPYVDRKDLDTFSTRCREEGLPFLTSTLPNIGRSLDTMFSRKGEWVPPDGFQRQKTGLPSFLGKALERAIALDPAAVDCVRQLAYVFYKLRIPHDPMCQSRVLDSFVENDSRLANLVFDDILIAEARSLVSRVLCNTDPLNIVPTHGPGATSCRTKPWDKWYKLRYFAQLDAVYSYSDYFFFSPTHLADELGRLEEAEDGIPQARVCLVPKDSRGPRVISCEPAELLYIQQGIMRLLYDVIERHPLTSGRINFRNQAINRSMAASGSLTGKWATMDLKDASDSVSLSLVEKLFPSNWVRALTSCRSTHTKLPDGRIVELQKFAPMGSSCCFPIEALVFWAIASAATRKPEGVYVYGDDIIVHPNQVDAVCYAFSSVGLKTNEDKTFATGPFRESCGGDYFLGKDVTPVRMREEVGSSCAQWISSLEFCNNLLAKFGNEAIPLVREIESAYGAFPRTELPIPGTLRLSPSASNDVFFRRRWNKDLQRFEHRIPRVGVRAVRRREPAWSELMKSELTRGIFHGDPADPLYSAMNERLQPGSYVVPHSTRMQWGWVWLG